MTKQYNKKANVPSIARLDAIAKAITTFGKFYNGYECIGEENIPKDSGALFVFYHGLMPIDVWYFGLNYYLKTGRLIRGLGDRWLFKVPLLKQLVESVGGVEGNYETAIKLFKAGELVGVSPGGVREAISGASNNYKLVWGKRKGFAKLALEANVPIVPAFTKNIEETYRAPFADSFLLQMLYEKTRLPLVPVIGLGPLPMPVKLQTVIGEPVYPEANDTPDSFARRAKEALEALIKKHQPVKPTVLSALKDR